jgi:hypothetical protein
MKKSEKNVTYLPIVEEKKEIQEPNPLLESPKFEENIKYGKYDIHFVISMLRKIVSECDKLKMQPHNIHFSLTNSLKRLIAMLEVERMQ